MPKLIFFLLQPAYMKKSLPQTKPPKEVLLWEYDSFFKINIVSATSVNLRESGETAKLNAKFSNIGFTKRIRDTHKLKPIFICRLDIGQFRLRRKYLKMAIIELRHEYYNNCTIKTLL